MLQKMKLVKLKEQVLLQIELGSTLFVRSKLCGVNYDFGGKLWFLWPR